MNSALLPLIAHVLHRFDTGGLENGVVNLINRMTVDRFRHAVIALTKITEFSRRIQSDKAQLIALNKPPGQGVWMFPRICGLLRHLQPAIVRTRNLGAVEKVAPAAWAGVPVRVRGEHGWDIGDPDGRSGRFRLARRLYRPFVHKYIALSRQLEHCFVGHVGVALECVVRLYNGVDAECFRPRDGERPLIAGSPFTSPASWLVGTVCRLSPIKDQVMLMPGARERMRLVIAGEDPLRAEIEQVLKDGGVHDKAWLAGDRRDVPEIMRGLDAFALPSIAEGTSNTILEAMASALPVAATDVGGNAELFDNGVTSRLVWPRDTDTMAAALLEDFQQPGPARERGRRACQEALRRFTLDGMVTAYGDLYERLLAQAAARGALQHRFT